MDDVDDEVDEAEKKAIEKEKKKHLAMEKREAAELLEIQRKDKELEVQMTQLLRQRTKKYRTHKSTIFFNGQAFIIEEEISINSDDNNSCITSDDSFETDDEGVIEGFGNMLEKRKRDRTKDK